MSWVDGVHGSAANEDRMCVEEKQTLPQCIWREIVGLWDIVAPFLLGVVLSFGAAVFAISITYL